MSEDYQYDSNVARNISPERSPQESSNSSTSDSSEEDVDLHKKKSDAAGFYSRKTCDEDVAVAEGNYCQIKARSDIFGMPDGAVEGGQKQ
ncbi:hypothetical protein OUZ56_023805 [Daphnia magna]|uniref:Uncharacterized protein n=1 Tax=Daphnia magna TaxID=35525 RepID=A0ABR0AZK3_9CRUS|nr:hypothetical protein OUZ56_023805 [Daphnia magna]